MGRISHDIRWRPTTWVPPALPPWDSAFGDDDANGTEQPTGLSTRVFFQVVHFDGDIILPS
jgi:hypothetical protein